MTQEEIKRRLHRLRYEGGWSIRGLSKQIGLSQKTVVLAMTEQVSEHSQRRLSNVLPLIPKAPPKKGPPKHKPGHLKRYLIRYYNLSGWLDEIEKEPGIEKKFARRKQGGMSRERAAYVCARYDYQMKRHLLDLFGPMLQQRKIVMGDCFQAERWIMRIHAALPGVRPALFKKIMKREIKK